MAEEEHVGDVVNVDNLPPTSDGADTRVSSNDVFDFSDLPDAIIVTNVDERVFNDNQYKEEFESLFRKFDECASFLYLKSFRRARVNYSTPQMAAAARIHFHEIELFGKCVKCFFAQPKEEESENRDPHLQPPPLEKQFLISPPASPPVGWEPVRESEPIINYDLIAAVANLKPGMAHEIHPPSDKHPAIVVHICEDPINPSGNISKPKIIQTRRPDAYT